MYEERSGWVTFAGILLLISGTLDVIYGIAAIGNSRFFAQNAHYVFGNLKTWGWIVLVIGILQVLAAGSLWRGGLYGRIIGIGAASLSAIGALLSIPAYPLWSLTLVGITVLVIFGLAMYGGDRDLTR